MKKANNFIIVAVMFICVSCFSDQAKYGYIPTSAGQLDEVLWVMDQELWVDSLGQTVKENLRKEYKILPQPEPEYQLREKTFEQFDNDIIKKYRIIVLVSYDNDASRLNQFIQSTFSKKTEEILDTKLSGSFIVRDVWAKPQIIMVIYASSKEALTKGIYETMPNILRTIRTEEDKRVESILFKNGFNEDAVNYINEQFDIEMQIPKDFYVAKKNSDFGWLRKETAELSSNIMFYTKDLSEEDISDGVDWNKYALQLRNYLGKEHIASTIEGSYMEIEDRFAEVLQDSVAIGDVSAVRTRGLWRIEGDFMGGPFVNYMWLSDDKTRLNILDGFVHAPRGNKKRFMRELENIFQTLDVAQNYSTN